MRGRWEKTLLQALNLWNEIALEMGQPPEDVEREAYRLAEQSPK